MNLDPKHLDELREVSNIPDEIIKQRGYYTAHTKEELLKLGFSEKQALAPALVIPIHGVDGDIVGHQIKPDTPREDTKYETPAGFAMRIDVPPSVLPKLGGKEDLWITEGIKKADSAAARGLVCVALLGVWNWRGKNAQGGSVELADWEKINIKGRYVNIAFDSDVTTKRQVKGALIRLAEMLKRRGAKGVNVVVLPADKGKKVGLDDYFVAGGSSNNLLDYVDNSILETNTIVINNRQLKDVTDEALEALYQHNLPPQLFVRAGELVRVVTDERSITSISSISTSEMVGLLARAAKWVKITDKGDALGVHPPKTIAEDILSLRHWPGFPAIVAVTQCPTLAPDLSCISYTPGYSPESHYYFAGSKPIQKWEGSVESAVDYIRDLFTDFSLDSKASVAHAIALMLNPIVRPAINGPTPLHLVEAPIQGSGKSIFGKICLIPGAGPNISVTSGPREEEEWRKKITAGLLSGKPYIFFDNLSHKIESDALEGALTSTEWEDRILSVSQNIQLPIRCTWVASANNAEVSRDVLRRSIIIRLDTGEEHPDRRKDFKYPDIIAHVCKNRYTILSALCKLVDHWLESGKPAYTGDRIGSFENWCNVVGAILQCAGVEGFLSNLDQVRQRNFSEHDSWAGFLARWWERYSDHLVKGSDLRELFEQDENLAGLLGSGNEMSRGFKLGWQIKKRAGAIFGGLRITREFDAHTKAWKFRLEPAGSTNPQNDKKYPQHTRSDFEPETLDYAGVDFSNTRSDFEPENDLFAGIAGISSNPTYTHADAHTHMYESRDDDPQTPQIPAPEPESGRDSPENTRSQPPANPRSAAEEDPFASPDIATGPILEEEAADVEWITITEDDDDIELDEEAFK